MNSARTAFVAIAAGAALLLTPALAHADGLTSSDVATDVEQLEISSAGVNVIPAPTRTQGDVVSTRISVLPRKVQVKTRFRDLSRVGQLQFTTLINSPKGGREITVLANSRNWQGKIVVRNKAGDKVRCNASRTVDYVHNTVVVVMPRSCLDNPGFVRVAFATFTYYGGKIWFDQAYKTGGGQGRFTFGPRVNL